MKTKAIIEIPRFSTVKYELDIKTNKLLVDRILNQYVPANYGFIPNTLAADGDPLDVFVLGPNIQPMALCKVTVLGMFKCFDGKVRDDKIIATIEKLNDDTLQQKILAIKSYLQTYKKNFKVITYQSAREAQKTIKSTSLKK